MNYDNFFGKKRRSSKKKSKRKSSSAQRRHQERAAKVMKLYRSGKASSLRRAWSMVRKG